MTNYKHIEFEDYNSNKRHVAISEIKYKVNEWSVLYVALKFDPIINCYRYLGSAISEKGIQSLVLLLRQFPDATNYAEIFENDIEFQKLKKHFDNEVSNTPVLCFKEVPTT